MTPETRINNAIQSIAGTATLDYRAFYSAKVLKDHGDAHLDLEPDDTRIPLLTRIPVRTFLPGVTVKVAIGARVLIGFDAADPEKPFATLYESGSLESLRIETTATLELIAQGPITIQASGDVILESSAETTIKASGDVVLEATGNVKLAGAGSVQGVLTEATQFTVVTDFFSGAGTATVVPGTSSLKVKA